MWNLDDALFLCLGKPGAKLEIYHFSRNSSYQNHKFLILEQKK